MKEINFSELLYSIDRKNCPKVVYYNGERFEYVRSLRSYVDSKKGTSLISARMKSMSWVDRMYFDTLLSDFPVYVLQDVLDDTEIRYLTNVIKPFKNDVLTIEKVVVNDNYRIRIHLKDIQTISLPLFPKDANMYTGMEVGKEYRLEDLGL